MRMSAPEVILGVVVPLAGFLYLLVLGTRLVRAVETIARNTRDLGKGVAEEVGAGSWEE